LILSNDLPVSIEMVMEFFSLFKLC
jgi:hypothetical protein